MLCKHICRPLSKHSNIFGLNRPERYVCIEMAKKKVREYHGKRLIVKHGSRLSNGKVTLDQVRTVLVNKNTDWNALLHKVGSTLLMIDFLLW